MKISSVLTRKIFSVGIIITSFMCSAWANNVTVHSKTYDPRKVTFHPKTEPIFEIKNTTRNTYEVGLSQAALASGKFPAETQVKALNNMKPLAPGKELTEKDFKLTLASGNSVFVIIKPPARVFTKNTKEVAVFRINPDHLAYLQIVPNSSTPLFANGDAVIPQSSTDVLHIEFETGLDNISKLGVDYTLIEQNVSTIRQYKL